MATRALKKIDFATVMTFTVAAGQTVTGGTAVIHNGADDTIQTAGASSDLVIGVALGTPGTSYAAGVAVQVMLLAPVVPMVVGTGGSTRGKKQAVVATGITDAVADNGGGTAAPSIGVALQSGVAGDVIGVMPTLDSRTTT